MCRKDRIPFARDSIQCFLDQKWPNKQLVVFNSTGDPVGARNESMLEIRLRHKPIGEMLNLCRDNADGEWCTTWCDDTLYPPETISLLMERRSPSAVVIIDTISCYAVSSRVTTQMCHPAAIAFFRMGMARFNSAGSIENGSCTVLRLPAVRAITKFVNRVC